LILVNLYVVIILLEKAKGGSKMYKRFSGSWKVAWIDRSEYGADPEKIRGRLFWIEPMMWVITTCIGPSARMCQPG